MKITISELIDIINQKTLLRLNKEVITKYEATQNRKIRVLYENGTTEYYGCNIDCIETLNAKYRLKLIFHNKQKDYNGDVEQIYTPKRNQQIEKIINALKTALDKVENSKKTVYFNISEIKKTLFSFKKELLLCNPYDLNASLSHMYNHDYSSDREMFIYFETIKKEINEFG